MTTSTSRRHLFAAGLGSALVVGAAAAQRGTVVRPDVGPGVEPGSAGVPAVGAHQAGVHRPAVAQPHLLLAVLDVTVPPRRLGSLLADLQGAIMRVSGLPLAGGVDPGDLTVTVGLGPRLLAQVDPTLPGAEEMPRFRRERIEGRRRGGDLMLQLCATDPLVPSLALVELEAALVGRAAERWRQRAFRGTPEPVGHGAVAPRNGQGFHDGVVVPRSAEELDDGVWIADGPAAGGTVAVVRRFAFDAAAFAALPVAEQEAVVGRRRESGAPLSGGDVGTEPDLVAKTPAGAYLLPADSHVRRSSALAAGVPLMLRRSYGVDDPEPGLLFVSFQSSLDAFTRTMARMDESDALMEFAVTTAAAHFLVLPGFDVDRRLGSGLLAT